MLKNISQNDLAIKVGFKSGSCIRDIEMNRKYPGREISQNLAQYFNLSTKYFYDEYLEYTDELNEKLINYRKNNNLNIKEAAKLIGVSGNTWGQWENGNFYASRIIYPKLKELNII